MNSSSDDKFDNDKEMVSPNFTPRRATRNRTKPKKYDEYLDMTPIKKETYYFVESSDEEVSQESALKSKALFGNDDVDGTDIFKFKSRHTKNDLQNKVKAAVIKSSNSPMKTPKKHILLKGDEATPRHVVDIMKKKIIQAVDNDSSESDFSGSSSDFVPDKSIEESEPSDVNSNPGSEDENEQQIPTQITASKNKVKQKHSEYFVTPDNYFMMNSSKKVKGKPLTKDETRTLVNLIANSPIITTKATNASNNMLKNEEWVRLAQKFNATAIFPRNPQQLRLKWENLKKNSRKRSTKIRMNQIKITTSDHTLARLKNMNLNENINEVDDQISSEHKNKITDLIQTHDQLFNRWLYILSENFNVILYGIGSKKTVLQRFQMEKVQNMPCIVVNGFFPSLTVKNILETIVVDLLENTHVPSNIGDVMNLIDAQLSEYGVDLFLIVHNIDGVMLRSSKAQSVLANLAQLKNVHLIATIDHINAPLLWDHNKLSKFNFTWWDVTTFLPYIEETSFENSLMTQRSGALQISSLKSVFLSLTSNAKGIFQIIIEYQLENHKQTHYQGLPFKDLYSKAREQFLVSSDLALRAQLTEFLDHKLVKVKRTYDGSENLVIPIDSALLQQFLEQQTAMH